MTQSNIVLHSTDNWPLGRALNSLAEECGSWWQAVLADRKCVISTGCDEEVVVRLGGNELLRARIVQGRVDVHVPEEYLYLSHPGYRVVLRAGEETKPCRRIVSLADFGRNFRKVCRNVLHETERRRAIQDRLWLRHDCLAGLDVALCGVLVDMVAVRPDGTCVCYLLRRYADQDILLGGPGGVVDRMAMLERQQSMLLLDEVRRLLERLRYLVHRQQRRFCRMADPVRLHPRVRLLVVDFDDAQRQLGIPELRSRFAVLSGRTDDQNEVITVGDPGNVSLKALFSGM